MAMFVGGGRENFGGLDRCPGFEPRVTQSRLLKASVIGRGGGALLDDGLKSEYACNILLKGRRRT